MINNYAIIENNIVVNTTVADESYAKLQGWILLIQNVGIGWSYIDGVFYPPVVPVPTPEQIQAQNKQQASTLLLETDWVELPSVSDINNIPYLLNKAEFIDYRIALRVIVVNPINAVFPVKPISEWVK
jgi:hypothetical protein